jgi:hypothetical protein
MKILKMVFFMTILSCAGCAPQAYWYNKNNTYERASLDCRECLYQAKIQASEAAAQNEGQYNLPSPETRANEKILFEDCMKEKGYKKTYDYNIDYRVKKGSIDVDHKLYDIAGE